MNTPKDIITILKGLFTNGSPVPQPVVFEWRLIRRKGRPFLLLPVGVETHVGLELYSAQRIHARILRALLPLLLKTPARSLFERVRVRADPASPLLQFMAEQSGVPVERLSPPAIKFGDLEIYRSRFVMLLCDEAKRPVKVIKAGLIWGEEKQSSKVWITTEREADQLEQLPPDIIGCIRMTGRFSTPMLTAFATQFFSGDSPQDDEGMENLFHSWLNPRAPVPLENLESWRQLAAKAALADPQMWRILHQAMAGRRVHSTVYHGDFAPWNIRATSEHNLQVFDWERAHREGIPAWDWFHFFVQTAILARRYHEKRVVAEVERLFESPRFRIYAAAARISDLVRPLFLAYLLYQKWVIKPIDGLETMERLYQLLAVRWGFRPQAAPAAIATLPRPQIKPGLAASMWNQLRFTATQLSNLIWEPSLSQVVRPALGAQLRTQGQTVLGSVLSLALVFALQLYCNHRKDIHLSFLVFYLVPCLWLTLKIDRRWGAAAATVVAVLMPLARHVQSPQFIPLQIAVWNMVMIFMLFQIAVILADRIREVDFAPDLTAPRENAGFADHWAVILAMGLFLTGVMLLDMVTSPQMNLLPLYLLPSIVLTLVVDRRWGMAAALIAAIGGPFTLRYEDPAYRHLTVELWNTVTRFVIFMAAVLILDRIRRGSVLFLSHRPETDHALRPSPSLAAISAELVPVNATPESLGN